jgi:tight adherence protein C
MSMLAITLSGVNWLVPAAVFGIFLFGAWAVVSLMADRDHRPLERLKRLDPSTHVGGVSNEPSLLRQQNRMQEILEMAAPALSKPLMPKSEFEQSQMKLRLATAGWRTENAVSMYLGLKLLLTAVGAVVGAAAFLRTGHISMQFWSVTAIGAGLGFYLPDITLAWLRKRRKDAIFYTLPDALDLMVVCVEAGLGLDAAMRRVSLEMRPTAKVLSSELEMANMQIQMGRPRREVLHDLGVRNGVDDLRSLAAILIQADRFGSSIAHALRVQSDSMRTRRKQQAEERAQKCAVKLLIPLILFIFPGIFVVLVGPAGIMISRNLGVATGAAG